MRNLLSLFALAAVVHLACFAQKSLQLPASSGQNQATTRLPEDPQFSNQLSDAPATATTPAGRATVMPANAGNRFSYYMTETYWNPSALTAPAFRAGLRMANPPGQGATAYTPEWRQGAEGFGRNYGDAFASRVSAHTAQFLTGEITREDPYYTQSISRGFFARSAHAIAFTFIDRTDSGRPMPAVSNFVGAAAGGFVGDLYLPDGFRDVTHAGQRATF
ncbi:MAG: hypothetical protein WBQ94_04005, partial [Terracidiphilus sp.]